MEGECELERRERFGGGDVALIFEDFEKCSIQLLLCLEFRKNAIGNAVEKREIRGRILESGCLSGAMLATGEKT